MKLKFFISFLFIFLILFLFFIYKSFFSFNIADYTYTPIKYTIDHINENEILIIPNYKQLKELQNEIITNKDHNIESFPLLVNFNKCNLQKIFPTLKYNNNQSIRIEIIPETDRLFTNIIFKTGLYKFEGFLLNKSNLLCFKNISFVNNIKPQTQIDNYRIIRNNDLEIKTYTKHKMLNEMHFEINDFSYIHSDIEVINNDFIIKSFLKKKNTNFDIDHAAGFKLNHTTNNPGSYSKYFLKRKLVGNLIDDLLFLSKDNASIKFIEIECSLVSNLIVILIFDKDKKLIYDHEFCNNKSKILFDIRNYSKFDMLISSYLHDYTSNELLMKIKIKYYL